MSDLVFLVQILSKVGMSDKVDDLLAEIKVLKQLLFSVIDDVNVSINDVVLDFLCEKKYNDAKSYLEIPGICNNIITFMDNILLSVDIENETLNEVVDETVTCEIVDDINENILIKNQENIEYLSDNCMIEIGGLGIGKKSASRTGELGIVKGFEKLVDNAGLKVCVSFDSGVKYFYCSEEDLKKYPDLLADTLLLDLNSSPSLFTYTTPIQLSIFGDIIPMKNYKTVLIETLRFFYKQDSDIFKSLNQYKDGTWLAEPERRQFIDGREVFDNICCETTKSAEDIIKFLSLVAEHYYQNLGVDFKSEIKLFINRKLKIG